LLLDACCSLLALLDTEHVPAALLDTAHVPAACQALLAPQSSPGTQREAARSSAYVSIRQHTSAYVSIRLQVRNEKLLARHHTSAYVSMRQHTSAYVRHTSAYNEQLLARGVAVERVCNYWYFCTSKASKLSTCSLEGLQLSARIRIATCIRQHTSAYVSIREHT
jgi:hypothetical protein